VSTNSKTKDNLIIQWKQLRGKFFNVFDEDIKKFEKKHALDPLYNSVIKHLDKRFTDVNQIANSEIEKHLNNIKI
jgi:hypothetical protein